MRRRLSVWALVLLLAAGCGRQNRPAAAAHHVSIAAAADLKFALDAIVAAWHRDHPETDLSTTYGSSGNFYLQILNGAPFDLFLSADIGYPHQLAAQGFTVEASEFVYAIGRLAVWVPSSSSLDIASGLAAVSQAKHVAIANPTHAPYGRAAIAALRSAGLFEAVAPRLVYGENVSQALQFAQTGAADAGIIALSLALAPPVQSTGRYTEVPSSSFPPIEQGGAILKQTADPAAAWAVRAFLLSDPAGAILHHYGFTVPEPR